MNRIASKVRGRGFAVVADEGEITNNIHAISETVLISAQSSQDSNL